MNYKTTERDLLKKLIAKFHNGHFKIQEWFDNLSQRFDYFLISQADFSEGHELKNVMRSIQSNSALVFFLMIHVPLANLHSMFCLVSCIFPVMLSMRVKLWIYEKANDFIVLIMPWDKEAKNHIVKPPEYEYTKKKWSFMDSTEIYLTKEETDSQEACVYSTIGFLSLYFGLSFNYLWSVFGNELVHDVCNLLIRVADSTGLVDLHFLRYLYLTLFPERPATIRLAEIEDVLLLFIVLTPLFVIGLRYMTAPVYLNYRWKLNSHLAPLAFIPLFFA